ncbi:MAG TPA: mechanosensitive ion channel family protein [Candidatus Binatia bacterium]
MMDRLKPMTQRLLWASLFLSFAFATSANAQLPFPSSSKAPTAPAPEQVTDPLGRSTPRGAITEFIRAAHRDDLVSAARYIQLNPNQRTDTEMLVRDLNQLMNRYFHQPLATISNSRDGAPDDGLPLDRERVGPLKIGETEIDIELVRVKDPEAGQIWLISSETLARVPVLYRAMEKTWVESAMPEVLVRQTVFGASLAQLILWAASLAIPLLLLTLVSPAVVILADKMIKRKTPWPRVDSWYHAVRWPSIFILSLAIHFACLFVLGFSLQFRIFYARFLAVLLVIALAWLSRRVFSLSFEYARTRMHRREQTGARSLLLLGERLFKVMIVLVAVFLALTIVGVDTKTALAGLGIIGVALAVGAQKTVENFLGGVFLLTDKALSVGDLCCISNRMGVVEDITLRSIRLRTLEQSLLSIPAGMLSQESIENFSTRGKILAQITLRLRYGTSTEQIRAVLAGIGTVLAENAKIETETSRVRLIDFGIQAMEVEIFAYVLTFDFLEFLSVREDLLLQIAGIVERSGSNFARADLLTTAQQPALASQTDSSSPPRTLQSTPVVLGTGSK